MGRFRYMKILMIFLFPFMLFAHSLSVTASYEDGELFIESYFGDGNPCKGCVFSLKKDGNELFKNILDDDGVFEQALDAKPPFDIHINGGMGHWADVKIDGSEMGEKSDTMASGSATM